MTEPQWTRRICAELRGMNALVFAIVAQRMQEPGWPDRYVAHTRWQGWLEFKGESTMIKDKQRIVLRKLCERGVPAYIVRFPGIVENWAGDELGTFDGTGRDLLNLLEMLS